MVNPVNERLDPNEYWKRPEGLQLVPAYWRDPEEGVRGMLSADRIQYYARLVGMISPFNEERLKPASYELTLGPRCQVEGRDRVLTPEKPTLLIPPNSIAFVSMGERLLLPHYIAARFNLRISLVYRGLLLGTGPQVDPGFQGVLSCPLHNISNNPIMIQLGEHVATIDFVKTTGIGEEAKPLLETIQTEEQLYAAQDGLLGHGKYKNRLFNKGKCWRKPILQYPSGEFHVSSSVAPLSKTIRRFRLASYIGLIVFLSLVVSLITLNQGSYRLYVDTKKEMQEMTSALNGLRAKQSELSQAHAESLKRLADIETKVPKPSAGDR